MYLFSEFALLPLILLLALWVGGGYLIVSRFDLPAHERGLVGAGVGLTLAALIANLIARVLPTPVAFWLAGLLTFAVGVILAFPKRRTVFPREAFQPGQWLSFLLVAFFLTLIGRGLGIFDDYQNLPQISSMALGDIPPHFVYDPRLLWSYHYFLLLVAAQFTRLADAGPWAALDLARGLTLALTLFYAGMLARRLTQNPLAGTLAALFLFLVGGARWLLLLLPAGVLNRISDSVTLIGSGADTGASLSLALYKYWEIQGLGPLPFPFLYGSGLDPSLTMAHAGYGASAVMLILLSLLLVGKSRGWLEQTLLGILFAALALANEVTFTFLYVGLIVAVGIWVVSKRTLKLPTSLWRYAPALIGGGVLVLLQGGVFTGVLLGLFTPAAGEAGEALYKVSFSLRLPTVLSAHLGTLSLFDPLHWFVVVAETGLVIFALPWALKYGWERVRAEQWLEAAWVFSMIPSLLTIFIEYTGNAGPTALSRMTAHFLLVLKIYTVPLLWLWARERSESVKQMLIGWGLAAALSGIALVSLQITAMPNPVYGEFLARLDAKMYEKHWGTLEPDALVFDPNPIRGTTVLGLHTRSGIDYGPPTYPEWLALADNPNPFELNRAGFRYLYLDLPYWRNFADHFADACVKTLDELQETDSQGKVIDQRLLLDVSACH